MVARPGDRGRGSASSSRRQSDPILLPSRPSTRLHDDTATLQGDSPLPIRLQKIPTNLHANQAYVAKTLWNMKRASCGINGSGRLDPGEPG